MLQNLIGPVADILDKFIEDKDQKARLSHEIATMAQRHAQEQVLAQLEVNKQEASHRNLWVAGWRPFVGWTCGVAMAWHFILLPVTLFITSFAGFEIPQLPSFDMDSLMTVLLGMLGLGGLRTFEKSKGLAR
jgi:hypothetical protein